MAVRRRRPVDDDGVCASSNEADAAFLAASAALCLALLAEFNVVRRFQASVPGFGLYF